jgi:hypothetical protein
MHTMPWMPAEWGLDCRRVDLSAQLWTKHVLHPWTAAAIQIGDKGRYLMLFVLSWMLLVLQLGAASSVPLLQV